MVKNANTSSDYKPYLVQVGPNSVVVDDSAKSVTYKQAQAKTRRARVKEVKRMKEAKEVKEVKEEES